MRARALTVIAKAAALIILAQPNAASAASADESWGIAWSVPASGPWQPALSGDVVIARSGDQVGAYRLRDAKRLWLTRIDQLASGRHVLAAGPRHVYVLADTALHVLRPTDGQTLHSFPLERATRVLVASGTPYVADKNGVKRLDAAGERVLGSTMITGTLERAAGDYAVLHRWIAKAKGPNRLSVVSLKDGAVAYEFKLLPTGDHRVADFDGERLVFVDHSRFDRGQGAKLYYTEADVKNARKLRDVALSTHFAQSRNEDVDVGRSASGQLYIASYGPIGAAATLLAYDPAQNRVLWTRSGNYAVSEISVFGGRLWTTVRGEDARTEVVAYDAESGDTRLRVPLEQEPVLGAPIELGERVLLRTRDKLLCLSQGGVAQPIATAGPQTDAPAESEGKTGWRVHRDPELGYSIEVPESWQLEQKLVKQFGNGRHAIPFVAYDEGRAGRQYVASVHVLVRPAGGQDVEAVWRSVIDHWSSKHRDVRVVRLRRFRVDGVEQIFGVYSFLDGRFNRQQARSLCMVKGGKAYELRARASATAPSGTWRRIAQIMRGFRVMPTP